MDLTTIAVIAALVLGLLIFGWAVFVPPRNRKTTEAPAMARRGDAIDDVAALMRAEVQHRRRKLDFGVDRYLDAVVNGWAQHTSGACPPAVEVLDLVRSADVEPRPAGPAPGADRPN
jgi:hypothetical protein